MVMLGRYRIDGKLGEGAMADVYGATDPEIGRTVAVKVLKEAFSRDPQIVARFLREARAAGALNHPNIATIYDAGQVETVSYIAMERVDGRPLDEVLAAQGRMPYERVLHLAAQLADALAYAHKAGVVHRDVKPSNILVSSDGRTVKLVDFGVARIGESEGSALAKTQAGQLIGTPRYMSPEQALGLPVDHRSDLFSLGVVLYEMVTGKVAFPGAGLATLAIQIAQEKVEPIGASAGDCPSGLRFIIDKLLAKKPEQRFADGPALRAALEREIRALHEPQTARRGLSLRVKLPLALVGVTAIALFLSIQAIVGRQALALEHMAVTSGNSIAAFVTGNAAVVAADNAGLAPEQQDWTAVQAFVESASQDEGVHQIVVSDEKGIVRAADREALIGRRYTPPRGERAVEGSRGVTEVADAGRGPGLRFTREIDYAGARFGRVDIVLDSTALEEALDMSRTMLVALAALVIAIVSLVGYLSAAAVERPLRRLREALRDAAQSGFALRISHSRRDEFGAAFDAFNAAAEHAEALIREDVAVRTSVVATRIAA